MTAAIFAGTGESDRYPFLMYAPRVNPNAEIITGSRSFSIAVRRGTASFVILTQRSQPRWCCISSPWIAPRDSSASAINQAEQAALVGECKWSVNPVRINILDDLKRDAGIMAKKSGIEHLQYVLFACKGFTTALKEQAAREKIGLFTVDDLVHKKE